MNQHAPAPEASAEDGGLIDIETACRRAASHAMRIEETEIVDLQRAAGRTLAEPISANLAVPAFDQSTMDGYAVALGGGMLPARTRLPVRGCVAAGDRGHSLPTGHAARILTGAPLPAGADAILMQEHGQRDGSDLVLHRMLRIGDNIRRRGEDFREGDHVLSPGTRLDARHVALLAAQGRGRVTMRRRLRAGVISTGNGLRQAGTALAEGTIYDASRPMLMTLAGQAGLDVLDGGWIPDETNVMSDALRELSERCDLVVTTGGAFIGEKDRSSAAAVARAGGICETLRIALKPGKPAMVGRIGKATYLGLSGNPVPALVSWLILGGAIVAALEGRAYYRSPGYPMPAAARFERRAGRMEFAPARIVPTEAGPSLEILGRGGSARLRPLIVADGLAEIHALQAPVEVGASVLFHPFRTGLAI